MKCISTGLLRNLTNFFIVSNVILETTINLFAQFLSNSHPLFDDGNIRNR